VSVGGAVVHDDDLVGTAASRIIASHSSRNSGRFSASSLAGTSTLTSSGPANSRARRESRRSWDQLRHACACALEDAELVAVLGDGASGDLHARLLEDLHDGLVGERAPGVFARHQLLDLVLDAARRHVVAVGSLEPRREEELERQHAARRLHELLVRDALTVDSCMPTASATSRSVSGLQAWTPRSKNSRCRSTMKCITLSIVWRRCSMAWIIHLAEFSLDAMKSLLSVSKRFLSRAMSW
jgi:hypothetical protein